MWYLAWFDDALVGFLAARGLPYDELVAAGFDTQIVHTSLDYTGGVGWPAQVSVAVTTAAVGRTSFTLDFAVEHEGAVPVRGRTVYVVVATDGSGKRPLPPALRTALA